jgi:hypothetical protein
LSWREPFAVALYEARYPAFDLILVLQITLSEPEDKSALGEAARVMDVARQICPRFTWPKDCRFAAYELVASVISHADVCSDLERTRLDGVDYPCASMVVGSPVESFLFGMRQEHETVRLAVELTRCRALCEKAREPILGFRSRRQAVKPVSALLD